MCTAHALKSWVQLPAGFVYTCITLNSSGNRRKKQFNQDLYRDIWCCVWGQEQFSELIWYVQHLLQQLDLYITPESHAPVQSVSFKAGSKWHTWCGPEASFNYNFMIQKGVLYNHIHDKFSIWDRALLCVKLVLQHTFKKSTNGTKILFKII